jgi:hypothetical protein
MTDPCPPIGQPPPHHTTHHHRWRPWHGPRASTGRAHARATDCAPPAGNGTVAATLARVCDLPLPGVLHALRTTKGGYPQHPLHLPPGLQPIVLAAALLVLAFLRNWGTV